MNNKEHHAPARRNVDRSHIRSTDGATRHTYLYEVHQVVLLRTLIYTKYVAVL